MILLNRVLNYLYNVINIYLINFLINVIFIYSYPIHAIALHQLEFLNYFANFINFCFLFVFYLSNFLSSCLI